MSTYLIGDIQGCYGPLNRMLDRIGFDPATDRLWCCGDLVNRGGKSLKVLRLLHGLGPLVSVTLGNHDLHLLAADHRHPEGDCRNREFAKILRAPERHTLIHWLASQPLAAWSPEFRLLRMHAGVIPQWDWQDTLARAGEVSAVLASPQRGEFLRRMYGNKPRKWRDNRRGWSRLRLICNILTRIRFCDAEGKALFEATGPPGSQPKPYLPWFRHKHRRTRDVTVAFGHWAALGACVRKRYVALDSGCVWGGSLSAFRLEDRKLFQVPRRKR
ncbi:MAG: symmetrical bis(5'-nucleosyl)-tetraphosphatase [Xanthomonadales bacterium]|nr:symmetrical bis(5'-nucleosyl)-tetraphosphatase [Xanthomonadales bacterium]NIN58606.1 symmetrical bis(5'-nucleosyl)-tetraphosphatase [Xanthomonadales bacterium]NIN73895.1 symmetrical bis(5'-nucleosyl)-tetraphosphatase [Xanthomonadales bacterium]NIO12364.1 symmetrical bis(5'-nucleosyl)-tetraphosphatase [Xanthomonadales bacterium]NIP10999.1 symmetrical bis(5'-nucleosyl)-tetraphosphatase [Xanthomonadales bacterium]